MKASELAEWLDGEVVGDPGVQAAQPKPIEHAGPGDVTFLSNKKFESLLGSLTAGIVLVSRKIALPERSKVGAFIRVADPYVAFARTVGRLQPPALNFDPGIHPTAVIARSAQIADDVSIGPHVFVGERTQIAKGARIGPLSSIGPDVVIGEDTLLHANTTVYHGCKIGKRVILHSGCVIGADGFGFAPRKDGSWEKIPQIGFVIIEDDVEIGAISTVDRGMMAATRIRRGCKLDDHVHVGHNCDIGEHSVLAAQVGISGSVTVGEHCLLGGQVGVSGHLQIAPRTTAMGRAAVLGSVLEPGQMLFGYPARPRMEALKREATLTRLISPKGELARMQQELAALRAELDALRKDRGGS